MVTSLRAETTLHFAAADLAARHPPAFTDANKLVVHARAAAGPAPAGAVAFSRWRAPALDAWSSRALVNLEVVPGFFRYAEGDTSSERHWHVNFANYDVFSCYAGPLLAQDELQVLEHPGLASVRLAARAGGHSTLCTDDGEPYPILVSGVERRIAFRTAPSPSAPGGLYGNQFARAPTHQVLEATTVLAPPSISNILAIEAPAYGTGAYSADTIRFILRTAAAGFRAAVLEPTLVRQLSPARTVIHTGFWGCGAYGGNRVLMTLLQLLAAELAGVERLVYYAADQAGVRQVEEAVARHAALPRDAAAEALVPAIVAMGYRWGVSNGT